MFMNSQNHVHLMQTRMEELGLNLRDLVERLGFEDRRKGFRTVKRTLNGHVPMGSAVRKFAKALEIEMETLEEAIDNSLREFRERRRFLKKKMRFKHFLMKERESERVREEMRHFSKDDTHGKGRGRGRYAMEAAESGDYRAEKSGFRHGFAYGKGFAHGRYAMETKTAERSCRHHSPHGEGRWARGTWGMRKRREG